MIEILEKLEIFEKFGKTKYNNSKHGLKFTVFLPQPSLYSYLDVSLTTRALSAPCRME